MVVKLQLLWKELLLFAFIQGLGLWTAVHIPLDKLGISPRNIDIGAKDIFWLVIFGVIFFFLITKGRKAGKGIVRFFLLLAVIAGSQLVFASFFPAQISSLLGIVAGTMFLFARNVLVHDIAMILSLAGIGAAFGVSISPIFAVGILLALSMYDIIAVYVTKHMVVMAEEMIKSENIFGLIIPERIKDFFAGTGRVAPGEGFMILGSGDVIMPVILASSVAIASARAGLSVSLFSIVGFLVTYFLFINQEIRRPMAALPPIAAASIIGYLTAVIFNL